MHHQSVFRLVFYIFGFITAKSFIFPGKLIAAGYSLKKHVLLQKTELYGIPKLFRWLVDLYPVVQQSVNDGLSINVDNFYLDMNG